MLAETRYTKSGDVNIAYQLLGKGPRDLVLVPGWVSNIDVFWEEPSLARFLTRLASFSRLILFDKRELARFRGHEIDTAGDGFLASFDGPARAVRCACAISDSVHALGIEVRAGVHTGECEIMGDKLGGISVHIGARVAALARPGEVLVSATVKDLVAGSALCFRDRGIQSLKGVPGDWRLYSVDR